VAMINQGKIDQENGRDLNNAINELDMINKFGHLILIIFLDFFYPFLFFYFCYSSKMVMLP
jgi:hypothetical protein